MAQSSEEDVCGGGGGVEGFFMNSEGISGGREGREVCYVS